jgi:hypothetical protein
VKWRERYLAFNQLLSPKHNIMKRLAFPFALLLMSITTAHSQGCVAIRNLAGFGSFASLGYAQTQNTWSLDINNRYFQAYDLYEGKTHKGYDSINIYEYMINFELSHVLKNGWSFSLDVPIASNAIVSRAEHASGERHSTHAFGVGDIRFAVYKWLFNTNVPRKGNIQIGLGIKLPTGNYRTEDYFYDNPNDKTAKDLAPVNVAIQLGDGGTGITTELNSFYIFSRMLSIYGNFFYLINPKNTNGVPAFPPNVVPPDALALFHAATSDVNSVPDNYTARGGANFTFGKLVGTAGLRYEGAPAHDLFGKNDGLRRVGHIFSVEPGIQYKLNNSFLYCFVTIPVDRVTLQTTPDKRITEITGQYSITAGHFAKALFYLGYTFTF